MGFPKEINLQCLRDNCSYSTIPHNLTRPEKVRKRPCSFKGSVLYFFSFHNTDKNHSIIFKFSILIKDINKHDKKRIVAHFTNLLIPSIYFPWCLREMLQMILIYITFIKFELSSYVTRLCY